MGNSHKVLNNKSKLRANVGLFGDHVAESVSDHNLTSLELLNFGFSHGIVDHTLSHLLQDFRQLLCKHYGCQNCPILRNNTYVVRNVD